MAWCIKTSVNGSKKNLQIEKDLIKAKEMTYDTKSPENGEWK